MDPQLHAIIWLNLKVLNYVTICSNHHLRLCLKSNLSITFLMLVFQNFVPIQKKNLKRLCLGQMATVWWLRRKGVKSNNSKQQQRDNCWISVTIDNKNSYEFSEEIFIGNFQRNIRTLYKILISCRTIINFIKIKLSNFWRCIYTWEFARSLVW